MGYLAGRKVTGWVGGYLPVSSGNERRTAFFERVCPLSTLSFRRFSPWGLGCDSTGPSDSSPPLHCATMPYNAPGHCCRAHRTVWMNRQSVREGSITIGSAKTKAALGFRAHSGWTALVAVAGPADYPAVVDRRRITLADPQIPGSKQPYHAAEGWPLSKATEYLDRCASRTRDLAQQALREIVGGLQSKGHDIVGCGILTASGRPLTTLAATLASHALIHTAEGEFYRSVLIEACEWCGLPVTRVSERELFDRAAKDLRTPAEKLRNRLTELGRTIGPPWTQDEKYSALLGWMLLTGAAKRSGRSSRRAQ